MPMAFQSTAMFAASAVRSAIVRTNEHDATRRCPAAALRPRTSGAAADVDAIEALFALPFTDLLFRAQQVHRAHHAPNAVQLSTLLSIKTGGCPEDCGYCPQAARYHTGVANEPLLDVERGRRRPRAPRRTPARRASAWAPRGADRRSATSSRCSRWCAAVKALGLETCCTLGMLKDGQAEQLQRRRPRLLQPQPRHRARVLRRHRHRRATTRTGSTRSTRVREAGINVCCGGIVGMGESRRAARRADRAAREPRSAARVGADQPPGAGRGHAAARALRRRSALDPLEFVRTIAVARITMPKAMVRLSAGRRELGEAVQALCFLAGANSIFYGDKLLTTGNPDVAADRALFDKLGLVPALTRRLHARAIAELERDLGAPSRRGPRAQAAHRSNRRRARASASTAARCSRSRATTISDSPTRRRSSPRRAIAAERWGVGAAASHLVVGHAAPHAALEDELAAFVAPLRRTRGARVFERLSRQPRDPDRARGARRRRCSPTGSITRA